MDQLSSVIECTIEELAHTAEVGLRLRAGSPEALFACAARGMFGLLHTQATTTRLENNRVVAIESIDRESLLVDWLNELLFLYATTGALYECEVARWSPTYMEAILTGCTPQTPPSMEIKAVTHHQVRVAEIDQEWVAEVYFDI